MQPCAHQDTLRDQLAKAWPLCVQKSRICYLRLSWRPCTTQAAHYGSCMHEQQTRCTSRQMQQLHTLNKRSLHAASAPVRRTVPRRSANMAASTSGSTSCIQGNSYHVSPQDYEKFHNDGFLVLKQVLTEEEMQSVVDPVYQKYMRREVEVPGKDLCDMSGAKGRTPDEFTVYNVMLPRIYYPAWQGNVLEQRCRAIANQLRGGDMDVDFDQIFAKRASSDDSAFLWHQDAAYWPPLQSDTSAVNCWLAVSNVTRDNGCLRYIPGSHREAALRPHRPVGASREDSHAICTNIDETAETIVDVPVCRGDVIVHHERVLHASYPNLSQDWRHAYILGMRKKECIAEERRLGFTHSHNATINWDVFLKQDDAEGESSSGAAAAAAIGH